MRIKFILILLLYCSLVEAQFKRPVSRKWARIGLFTSSVILNAVGDGLYDDGHKILAKSFRVASIGSLIAVPLVSPLPSRKRGSKFKYLLTYSLVRVGLFDISYNVARRLPLTYMGTTSVHDRILGGQPRLVMSIMRISSIGVAIQLNNQLSK